MYISFELLCCAIIPNMNYIKTDNINIPELEIYKKLRDNAFTEDNSFIADSPKVVNMLLRSDIKVKSILATKEYAKNSWAQSSP
jgi:hypothetical protein